MRFQESLWVLVGFYGSLRVLMSPYGFLSVLIIVIVITFFIHQVALARRQRNDLSVFESSCHLPICLPHTMEASHCPFNC